VLTALPSGHGAADTAADAAFEVTAATGAGVGTCMGPGSESILPSGATVQPLPGCHCAKPPPMNFRKPARTTPCSLSTDTCMRRSNAMPGAWTSRRSTSSGSRPARNTLEQTILAE